MKYIYILILILLSTITFAYDINHLINITTVPICNNYNIINIRSDINMVTNETVFPIGKCKTMGTNLYQCPCTKDNIVYINATEAGLYNFFVTYYINPLSVNNTATDEHDYGRLISIPNIQIDSPPVKSDFMTLFEGAKNSDNIMNVIYIIIAVAGVVVLIIVVLIYKFVIVPWNKEK